VESLVAPRTLQFMSDFVVATRIMLFVSALDNSQSSHQDKKLHRQSVDYRIGSGFIRKFWISFAKIIKP